VTDVTAIKVNKHIAVELLFGCARYVYLLLKYARQRHQTSRFAVYGMFWVHEVLVEHF
jgi:hypothetical protein